MTAGAIVETAVARLEADGFLAYPTETVWGLGACADRPIAIERLRSWKGREEDSPLAVLVASVEDAVEAGCRFDSRAMRLARAFWPGPLMLIVPCERSFARGVARDDGALGLRCSSHPLAQALVAAVGLAGLGPLTSTSLNRSGERPAMRFADAETLTAGGAGSDFDEPLVLAAADLDAGGSAPSSIVDCTGADPRILRVGALGSEMLRVTWMDREDRSGGPPPDEIAEKRI